MPQFQGPARPEYHNSSPIEDRISSIFTIWYCILIKAAEGISAFNVALVYITIRSQSINSLWPSDSKWQHGPGSLLAQLTHRPLEDLDKSKFRAMFSE